MIGDIDDFVARIRQVLPAGWFADDAPVLTAVLTGLGQAWSDLYSLLMMVARQARIATASGVFLDIAAQDYFGGQLRRRTTEGDAAFSARIRANLLAPRATRDALAAALMGLTGRTPLIFEPRNIADTGAYNVNAGYNCVGGYGSFGLPYQFFVTAYRPNDMPMSNGGGYGAGPGGYDAGPLFYAAITDSTGYIDDAEIYLTISETIPTASIAWTTISN
jgi:hypothetical protein